MRGIGPQGSVEGSDKNDLLYTTLRCISVRYCFRGLIKKMCFQFLKRLTCPKDWNSLRFVRSYMIQIYMNMNSKYTLFTSDSEKLRKLSNIDFEFEIYHKIQLYKYPLESCLEKARKNV